MATGAKTIETRHWSTNVRGQVAIHAAQRMVKSELDDLGCYGVWKGALAVYRHHNSGDNTFLRDLPFGAIVAVGTLTNVLPTRDAPGIDELRFAEKAVIPDMIERAGLRWTERDMGNYESGRFAWLFDDIRPLSEPVPFKGKQGFFTVPDELLAGRY